jgi:signal transduction histidine kinase/CheY-like chemotaxis protein
MSDTQSALFGRPSRAVSWAASIALIVAWAVVRLWLFRYTIFPLTYVIPMLVCVWTRDRQMLRVMAAAFAAIHSLKLFVLGDAGLEAHELWANYAATMLNIGVGAAVIEALIRLRDRVDASITQVLQQSDELRAQGEELAQQNEELATQTEELTAQGEELANQNEELQTQSEEIAALNDTLEHRGTLLQALLDSARLVATEQSAMRHIADAGVSLFAPASAVVVFDGAEARVFGAVGSRRPISLPAHPEVDDEFVRLVIRENRTACLNDAELRPDLRLLALPGLPAPRAVLATPLRRHGVAAGAIAVYFEAARAWSDEDFRVVEWLGEQCGRMLEMLRMQSELRASDQRKSEFLATLSHELRNPLAPITFALDLLEQNHEGRPDAVRVLRRQVQQLSRLVDDLLDATRLSSNKVQIRRARLDLRPVLQHAVDAVRPEIERASTHHLTLTLPDEPIWADADAARIAQVVTNLLNNAIRYTPRDGRIAVALGAAGGSAAISVRDSGIGLEATDLHRVFDMFTQIHGPGSGGLGIGLALVKGIVELHGGSVEVRSEGPGKGSEFLVTLPLADRPAAPAPTETVRSNATTPPRRVLVVDDNVDSAGMMGTLLEFHGHSVWVAGSAEAALDIARNVTPDVALLDIGLPGLSGYDLARRMRQDARTRTTRLIALTGWGQESDRSLARDAGFDVHLTKPAELKDILAAIGAGH